MQGGVEEAVVRDGGEESFEFVVAEESDPLPDDLVARGQICGYHWTISYSSASSKLYLSKL